MLLRSGKQINVCVHCRRNAYPYLATCANCYWEHWDKTGEPLLSFMKKAK